MSFCDRLAEIVDGGGLHLRSLSSPEDKAQSLSTQGSTHETFTYYVMLHTHSRWSLDSDDHWPHTKRNVLEAEKSRVAQLLF